MYRSKAPLRIGLAGGGTDVSPYCNLYGGAVLNATIALYAYAHIEPLQENAIIIQANDLKQEQRFEWTHELPIDGKLDLLKGVYNKIQQLYSMPLTGFRLSTFVDAPAGSGLGTSSTLVVAMVGAFVEMLRLPLGEYDIAKLAFDIERNDLKISGGRQDQYAAAFGGVNFMEFVKDGVVIVNPLRIKEQILLEVENNLLLYYTGTSRDSAAIIARQSNNVVNNNVYAIEAMHQLKQQSVMMKEALLKGRLHEVGEILDFGYEQKRKMATGISNSTMEEMYEAAKKAGATGGKISGAGGGGFMIFYCPDETKYKVKETLEKFGGYCKPYQFTPHGLTTWTL